MFTTVQKTVLGYTIITLILLMTRKQTFDKCASRCCMHDSVLSAVCYSAGRHREGAGDEKIGVVWFSGQ